jgi:hypothetical protein
MNPGAKAYQTATMTIPHIAAEEKNSLGLGKNVWNIDSLSLPPHLKPYHRLAPVGADPAFQLPQ